MTELSNERVERMKNQVDKIISEGCEKLVFGTEQNRKAVVDTTLDKIRALLVDVVKERSGEISVMAEEDSKGRVVIYLEGPPELMALLPFVDAGANDGTVRSRHR